MAGSDRADGYRTLVQKYNGVKGPHGFYNFTNGIDIIPVGDKRVEGDGDSVSSFSGSAMRAAAVNDDKENFDKMASPLLSPEDKDKMRGDIKAGLAKFATKRNKKITEEVVGSVDARGLGFVTGVPAVQGSEIANYVEKNTADSDQKDNILKTFKKFHIDHHTKIFKSFLDKK